MFLANISGAVQYGAVSWQLAGLRPTATTGRPSIPPSAVHAAEGSTTTTSKVFHCGYIGKQRYVQGGVHIGGAETGQITALLGHGMSQPVWQTAVRGHGLREG